MQKVRKKSGGSDGFMSTTEAAAHTAHATHATHATA